MQALSANPELGMHDLLPGLDQYLVSLALQAAAQGAGGSSGAAGAGGSGAAGMAAGGAGGAPPRPGDTFAALQQPPAGWGPAPAGAPAAEAAAEAASGGVERSSLMSDKHCLLALLLASDAGPPPALLSLDATAHEVRDVLAHMPRLPAAAAGRAAPSTAGAAAAAGSAFLAANGLPAEPSSIPGAAAAAGSAFHAAGGPPAEPLSIQGAGNAPLGVVGFDAPLFPFASAPAGVAEAVAATVERTQSPGVLIWPTGGSGQMDDPADTWRV